MEELISHFVVYSEGFALPSGVSSAGVEAPKGHLGVSVVSSGGVSPDRSRIRSPVQVISGQLHRLTSGLSLGDFVVVVSGSNVVVGELDR